MSAPDELAQLQTSNNQRVAKLAAIGVQLNGIEQHFVIAGLDALLRHLLPPAEFAEFQLAHERWLQPQLDQAEKAAEQWRADQIKNGIAVARR